MTRNPDAQTVRRLFPDLTRFTYPDPRFRTPKARPVKVASERLRETKTLVARRTVNKALAGRPVLGTDVLGRPADSMASNAQYRETTDLPAAAQVRP